MELAFSAVKELVISKSNLPIAICFCFSVWLLRLKSFFNFLMDFGELHEVKSSSLWKRAVAMLHPTVRTTAKRQSGLAKLDSTGPTEVYGWRFLLPLWLQLFEEWTRYSLSDSARVDQIKKYGNVWEKSPS